MSLYRFLFLEKNDSECYKLWERFNEGYVKVKHSRKLQVSCCNFKISSVLKDSLEKQVLMCIIGRVIKSALVTKPQVC